MDLWALARFDLSLSDAEFLALTPRQFDALCQRLDAREQREDYRAGVGASLFANAHRDPKQRRKPYGPHDFFPSLKPPRPQTKDPAKIQAEVLAFVRRGQRSR